VSSKDWFLYALRSPIAPQKICITTDRIIEIISRRAKQGDSLPIFAEPFALTPTKV
jgi:hypothetical protein